MKTFEEYRQETGEVGQIESIVHSIAYVSGLPGLRPKEVVIAEGGQRGIVQSLSAGHGQVLMLDTQGLTNNLSVARTGQPLMIPVSPQILGRVVSPFGLPLDGDGPVLGDKKAQPIEPVAPGIDRRVRISRPLESGITIVDLLVPIGYGQRELVIGDKKTGKTTFILQTLASQAAKGVICVYVSIGKRGSDVKAAESYLKETGAILNTAIVVATAADPASMVYLAPFSGLAIAEFFRDQGKDVLIAFDDLTNHAKFYREISLLSKRTPGRASYPGDIFHIHAALLERVGNVKLNDKVVSITALPMAETLEGDLTGYIQTNLMAITDGHLFFDIEEFRKGQRPPIHPGLSVSRVGNQTKTKLEREIAQSLREALIRYTKALDIARFGVELPEATKAEIDLGEKIQLLFNQDTKTLLPKNLQLVLVGLLLAGFWTNKNQGLVKVDLIKLVQKYQQGSLQDLVAKIDAVQKLPELLELIRRYTDKVKESMYV